MVMDRLYHLYGRHLNQGLIHKLTLAEHIWLRNHKLNWEQAMLIYKNLYTQKLIETTYIKLSDNPTSQNSVERNTAPMIYFC